jgi:hypothetical protein
MKTILKRVSFYILAVLLVGMYLYFAWYLLLNKILHKEIFNGDIIHFTEGATFFVYLLVVLFLLFILLGSLYAIRPGSKKS